MKKILLVVLCLVLACAVLAGCSGGSNDVKGTWRQSDEMIEEMMNTYKSVRDVTEEEEAAQREEFKNEIKIVFDGNGKAIVTATHNGEIRDETIEYEIDGDKITIGDQQLEIKDGIIYREDGVPMLVKD